MLEKYYENKEKVKLWRKIKLSILLFSSKIINGEIGD